MRRVARKVRQMYENLRKIYETHHNYCENYENIKQQKNSEKIHYSSGDLRHIICTTSNHKFLEFNFYPIC